VAAALATFGALAVVVKLHVWTAPTTRYAGSYDSEATMWFLSWPPYALSHLQNPLVTTYLNSPTGFSLLWNTSMPALGVLMWPFTAVWGAVLTYNLITTASMALGALFAFLAIRRYVDDDLAAAAGGLLFGFSPAVVAQQSHANVAFCAVTIPLALLLLDELLVRQRWPVWRTGVLIAALGAFQFLVFPEFFVTELLAAVILTVVLGVTHRNEVRERYRYVRRALGIGAALSAALLAYPVGRAALQAIQTAGLSRVLHAVHDPGVFSTDLLNPVVPTRVQWISPTSVTAVSNHFSGNLSEANGYIGIPLLVLSVVVLVRYWRVPTVRVAGLTAVIIGVLSLGPHLVVAGHSSPVPLPGWVLAHLPVLDNILPSRMMAIVFLPLGIALAFVLHRLWIWRRNVLLCALVAAVVLVPLAPKVSTAQTLAVPQYFTSPAVDEIPTDAVVYTMPFPAFSTIAPMNWQWASGMRFRLIGGYFIGPPATGQEALRAVAGIFASRGRPRLIGRTERASFLRELRANHVGVVIVGPMPNQQAAVVFATRMLGFAPRVRDGLDVWILAAHPD
jgi:hypothetical protein